MADSEMRGKVCLVTGTTAGIGKVTASELARMGATVVMLCRDRAKGDTVQKEISTATGNPQVELIVADLSSLDAVRRAADEFKQRHSQLHVLINNAGGINSTRKTTPDGLEYTFATNYLAPFLLTELLLDTLKASAPARIINVSSRVHAQVSGKLDFDDLQGARGYRPMKAYAQSKLAQIFFTYALAERLKGTGVTANALHPGIVSSNFVNGMDGIQHRVISAVYSMIGISVEKGAETSLYLATSPEVEGVSGKYFSGCKVTASSRYSYDVAAQQRLWEVSEQLIHQSTSPHTGLQS